VLPLSVLSPTADVQKMTQTEERQSAVFTELYYSTNCQLACST